MIPSASTRTRWAATLQFVYQRAERTASSPACCHVMGHPFVGLSGHRLSGASQPARSKAATRRRGGAQSGLVEHQALAG